MTYRWLAFSSCGLAALATPALAQTSQPAAQPAAEPAAQTPAQQKAAEAEATAQTDEFGDEAPIVVTGSRPRGSVIGDIPPQNVLDTRDIRATGASSIDELLQALAPQIGSSEGRASGGRPVLLINGQRISGFRELRDIPPEAIERMEILPEEVALKYGYRADQKVVNIVLRQRFRSVTAQAGATVATDGGYAGGNLDLTQFRVQRNGRTTFNAHVEGNGMLTEAERNILVAPSSAGTTDEQLAARSLLGTKRDVRVSGTENRQIGTVSATLNAEFEHQDGRSLVGLGDTLLLPLARNTSTDTSHLGTTLNGTKSDWRWTVTGNADVQQDVTRTDRDAAERDRSRQTLFSSDLKATANGNLFSLPAGVATTTLTLGGSTTHLDSERQRLGLGTTQSLGRTTGQAAINVDLPISRKNRDFSALGNLTLNANAEVDQLSDFGTLTTIGAGANWTPVNRLNLLTSWSREEGPPTINQLGDAVIDTPGTRIFDFTTGQTVLATVTTGGNPNLKADTRTVFKLGGNWQPLENTDLRLRAEYVKQTIDRPISSLTVSSAIEAAFPDRFQRGTVCDADGNCSVQLVSADLRPVNFDRSERQTLRLGFDFTKPLKSRRPSQSVMDQLRAQFVGARQGAPRTNAPAAGGAAGAPAANVPPGSPPAEGAAPAGPPAGGREGGFRGGGGGGGGGGRGGGFFGGNRGRLTFSLTDTVTLVDKVRIGAGLPEIDYLHGDPAGQSGGTPRHKVEAQAGYFNNGIGARVSANWRSATNVNTLTGDNLHFSPVSTFDLRLFANPGDIPEQLAKHPWLRGTQVRFEVDNLFNARPKVHDALGTVPLNYQPGLLDPLGRTVMISFRKLFLPSPASLRREFQQRQQQEAR